MWKKIKQKLFLAPTIETTPHRSEFTEHDATLMDGTNIHFASAGKGKTIVFLHGLANNWETWIPVSIFLKNQYRVILLDLPGYGGSSHLSEYSLEKSAAILAEFIMQEDLQPEAVVGLSLGSQLATRLVHDYPEITKKVILNGAIFKIHNMGRLNTFFTDKLHDLGYVKIIMPFLSRYIKNTFASYTTSKYLNYYKFNRKLLDSYTRSGKTQVDPLAWLQLAADAAEIHLEDLLIKLKIQVLLIFGDHDRWTTVAGAKSLMPTATHISYQQVKDAGHSVSIEKSEDVAKAIRDFVG